MTVKRTRVQRAIKRNLMRNNNTDYYTQGTNNSKTNSKKSVAE